MASSSLRLAKKPKTTLYISCPQCSAAPVSAVRTTLLSKRWNKLWTSVRHLDFDIVREMIRYRSRFESFVQFVFLRLSSPDIGKFRLRYVTSPYSNSDSSLLSDWVSAAIWLNVVELDLKILNGSFEYLCDLPQSIFWCKTLKVLKLWIDSDIAIPKPPTSGCFPSLKIFHLTVINPGERLGILLSYFPVLEDLSIHGHVTYSYSAYSNMNVKVSTPELKTLKLSMERAKRDFMYDDDYYETPKHNSFCVDAPKLENLEVIQIPLSNVILENPKSVVHASIAFKSLAKEEWPSFPDRAYQLLTGISNVKCLSLLDQPFEASNLPVFGNLNQLRLVLRNRNSWEFLTLLLPKTPNLEDLDLVLEDGTEGQKDDPELEWTPPELVPDCLSSNLKTYTTTNSDSSDQQSGHKS
uniref:putative F-box/FBD/LRR-repeat protein At4g00315 n=1 Tax=Fragaria vesca subsp. vesca TaxID=101020 RepID=UPI0005CAD06F|nr:PREDICTED: putative F-box/FBD/LRR-repeat protein At4g00315 [Fragaria vesca subsp. vesca]